MVEAITQVIERLNGFRDGVDVRVTVEQVVAAPAARDDVRGVEDPRSREARCYRLLRYHVVDRELKPSLKD